MGRHHCFRVGHGIFWGHPGRRVAPEYSNKCRRDSTLFQFTSKRLRDFIDPNHLLIQIDEQLDFAKLVAPLDVSGGGKLFRAGG